LLRARQGGQQEEHGKEHEHATGRRDGLHG
jgi:hypothetical protein